MRITPFGLSVALPRPIIGFMPDLAAWLINPMWSDWLRWRHDPVRGQPLLGLRLTGLRRCAPRPAWVG